MVDFEARLFGGRKQDVCSFSRLADIAQQEGEGKRRIEIAGLLGKQFAEDVVRAFECTRHSIRVTQPVANQPFPGRLVPGKLQLHQCLTRLILPQ